MVPRKRRISAAVLLSVILPAVLLAPFHHHEHTYQADAPCDACAQHQPHPGHLSGQSDTDDCLVCQLLGQQYVPSEGMAVCFSTTVSQPYYGVVPADTFSFVYTLSSPRAPPASFCI